MNTKLNIHTLLRSSVLCAAALLAVGCMAPADGEDGEYWDDYGDFEDGEDVGEVEQAYTGNSMRLCVKAADKSGGGTNNNVKLIYEKNTEKWSCTLSGGVDRGEKRCCTDNTPTNLGEHEEGKELYVDGGSDGLLIDNVYWTEGTGDEDSVTRFKPPWPNGFNCHGCNSWGTNCSRCWQDSNGHNDCERVFINPQTGAISCYDGFY